MRGDLELFSIELLLAIVLFGIVLLGVDEPAGRSWSVFLLGRVVLQMEVGPMRSRRTERALSEEGPFNLIDFFEDFDGFALFLEIACCFYWKHFAPHFLLFVFGFIELSLF